MNPKRPLNQNGNEATTVVATLFEKWSAPLCAYLYRLVGDEELAYDLTQEVFLRLFRTRDRLPEVENRRAWLYRIATNLAFDTLRRQRKIRWLPWYRAADRTAPEQRGLVEQIDQRASVERALHALPPEYRAPLLLYSYYGLKVREVAEVLELSESAVKMRLYRARELFRQSYQDEG